jgi:hypothetical protein
MQKLRLILMASGLALLLPVTGYTQSISDLNDLSPEDRRAYMQSMSPDERSAMREKWRAELDAMPEEERQAMRESMAANRPEGARSRDARRERWESMSEEERADARRMREERMLQRREKWESMSDEERAAAREKKGNRMHHGQRDGGGHKGKARDVEE